MAILAILAREILLTKRHWSLGASWLTESLADNLPQLAGQLTTAVRALHRVSPSNEATHIAIAVGVKEKTMFAVTDISRSTQRFVCLLMAAVVVAASLSLGALGAESAAHPGYSVTITQIQ